MSATTTRTEDTKEIARTWAAYVKQGETWVPKDRDPIKISDMDPRWRANAARWLLRQAGVVEFYYTAVELSRLRADMSDHVADALTQETDRRADDPQAWLKTMPLYQALVKDLPELAI